MNTQTWHDPSLVRKRYLNDPQQLNFNHNDYLGLSQHPDIIKAVQQGLEQYGIGSSGSALMSGYHSAHQDFELAFAEHTGHQRALLFNSGYMANLSLVRSFATKDTVAHHDHDNHASLIDGTLISQATCRRFPHLNYDVLKKRLQKNDIVISDHVFSATGDIANGEKLEALCHNNMLIIDNAHSFGVIEKKYHATLNCYPLGKAMGLCGAMVCGDHDSIEQLIQFARNYRYTTALPPAMAVGGIRALTILQQETWRREKLQENINYFYKNLAEHCINANNKSAIFAIGMPSAAKALTSQKQLLQHNINIGCFRPPSAPRNQSLLRLTLSAQHSIDDINHLIKHLRALI